MIDPFFRKHPYKPRTAIAVATYRSTVLLSREILILLAVVVILLARASGAAAQTTANALDQAAYQSNIRDTTWTRSNCNNCHVSDTLFSHPVDILPSMSVPAGLPLENGRVTCVTCHDNTSSQNHIRARVNRSSMLRDTGGKNLCQQCHDPMQMGRDAMHGAMLGQAHLASMTTRRSFSSVSFVRKTVGNRGFITSGGGAMDTQSRNCLTCHDGSIASDVSGGGMGIGGFGSRGAEHPVGTVYPATGNTRISGGPRIDLVLPMSLDKRIKLVEGKVSCISCHSPYSKEEKLLVMSNNRSNLCLSCHLQ